MYFTSDAGATCITPPFHLTTFSDGTRPPRSLSSHPAESRRFCPSLASKAQMFCNHWSQNCLHSVTNQLDDTIPV